MNPDYIQNLVRSMKTPYGAGFPYQQPCSPVMPFNPYCLPGGQWPCGDTKEVKMIKQLLEKVTELEAKVGELVKSQKPASSSASGYMRGGGYY